MLAIAVVLAHLSGWAPLTVGINHLVSDGMNRFLDVVQPAGETYPAVLGFIVLSGYCIHRNGLRREEAGFSSYAIRRSFRIVPVYLVAVAFGIGVFLFLSAEHRAITTSLSGTTDISTGCVAVKVFGTSAFIPGQHTCSFEGNAPLTTVMVEMWLYLVYALICFALLRGILRERLFWPILAVVWIAGLVWVSREPQYTAWWHNGSLIGFLGYWWIGAKFTDPAFAGWMRRLTIPLIATYIGLTVVLMNDPGASIFLVELRKVMLALLFGIGIVAIESLAAPRVRTAGKLGQSGYSIYAFHAPILMLLLILGVPWYLVLAAAIGGGLLSFYSYERPLTRVGRRLAGRRSKPEDRARTREPGEDVAVGQSAAAPAVTS